MKFNVCLSLIAGALFALLSSTAEAQLSSSWFHVPVPTFTGTNFIGTSNGVPIVLNDSTCRFFFLNPDQSGGPLKRFTQVDGDPTHANSIFVVPSPTNVCGVTLNPIQFGAFKLDVYGGSADDFMFNPGLAKIRMFGFAGNDFLINVGVSGIGILGDAGNDVLLASGPDATVQAMGGSDLVCSTSAGPMLLAIGGNDVGTSDTFCGSASAGTTGFETRNCTCPIAL